MIPVDDYVRRLPFPTDVQAAAVDPGRQPRTLARVLSDVPRRRRRGHLPRRIVVPGVVVLVTSLIVGAWAVSRAINPDQMYANCYIDRGLDGVAAASSDDRAGGTDPVQRCQQLWDERALAASPDESYAGPAPDMSVYTDGRGTLAVIPDGWDVPSGLVPAEGEVVVDDRRARLEAALGDYLDGLHSRCHSGEEAAGVVRRELALLGLGDWTVGEPPKADGTLTCASAYLRGRTVTFWPEEPNGPMFGGDVYPGLAELRTAVTEAGCLSLKDAGALTRSILPSGFYTEVVDDSMDCAVVNVAMGGDYLVSIYGP